MTAKTMGIAAQGVFIRRLIVSTLALSVIAAVACFSSMHAHAKKQKEYPVVQDLRYGQALYAYYQQDYIDALTQLLKAKKQGGIQGHGDDPIVMEGGFALSFGMEQYASSIFETALADTRDEKTSNAAWLYVGQVQYDQGQYEKAIAAVEKISSKTNKYIQSRKEILKLNSLIRLARLEEAQSLAKGIQKRRELSPYVNYNFGAAFGSRGEFALAQDYFGKVQLVDNSSTKEALFDRTKIAQGYAYLLNENFDEAVNAFNKVGLLSPLVNRALLGYGWAEIGRGNTDIALIPWRRLAQSDTLDTSAQEALLAVPYAYEKLDKVNRAIEAYEQAEISYQQEVTRLKASLDKLDESLILDLIRDTDSDDNARSVSGDTRVKLNYARDTVLDPELIYFSELFAKDAFQENIQHLRDLLSVEKLVQSWQNRVDFYREEIARRETTRKDGRYQRITAKLSQDRDRLRSAYDALNKKIIDVERNQKWLTLADADTKDMLMRVNPYMDYVEPDLKANIAQGQADTAPDENIRYKPGRFRPNASLNSYQQTVLRRSTGLLLWDASESFMDRLWKLKSDAASLEAALKESDKVLARTLRAQNQAMDLSNYQTALISAKEKVVQINTQSLAAQTSIVNKLLSQMQAHLRKTLSQIEAYQAQARLSVARLYDLRRERTLDSGAQDSVDEQEAELSSNNATGVVQ